MIYLGVSAVVLSFMGLGAMIFALLSICESGLTDKAFSRLIRLSHLGALVVLLSIFLWTIIGLTPPS